MLLLPSRESPVQRYPAVNRPSIRGAERARFRLLLPVLLVLIPTLACTREPGNPSSNQLAPASAPTPVQEVREQQRALIPAPPDADPYDITQRLRQRSQGSLPRPQSAPPPPRHSGTTDRFTVTDLQQYTRSDVTATLRLATPHAYWYVDDSLEVDQTDLEASAQEFETKTYPTNTRYFGDTIKGGFDGDPHLTVLTTRFGGAAGYYSSPDEFPRDVHPYSNQRVMLYINGGILRPGSPGFNSVVAHELQHALHWHADPNEESWVNEGLSMVAEELNGFAPRLNRIFERSPKVQLTQWEDAPSDNTLHYASAYLFLRYLADRVGGFERMKELVADPRDGTAGVDSFLQRLGVGERFADIFRDWLVTNTGLVTKDPRYRYNGIQLQVQPDRKVSGTEDVADRVPQYAARYIELRPNQPVASLRFSGPDTVKLLPTAPPSGRAFWWSNRGDAIDSHLTRELDLTGAQSATLRFKTWFNIEKGWDYAYVTVSSDGGRSWEILSGTETSTLNPLGNSYGPGYTGTSGNGKEPRWVEESLDLSRYAGKKIILRFEYVTDEAVNGDGLALDDIQVPEIGFSDDAEGDRGWDARGFIRTENAVPQDYVVQVVEVRNDGTEVRRLPLDAARRGSLDVCCFGRGLDYAVVVVGSLAPTTTVPAEYRLTVETHQ